MLEGLFRDESAGAALLIDGLMSAVSRRYQAFLLRVLDQDMAPVRFPMFEGLIGCLAADSAALHIDGLIGAGGSLYQIFLIYDVLEIMDVRKLAVLKGLLKGSAAGFAALLVDGPVHAVRVGYLISVLCLFYRRMGRQRELFFRSGHDSAAGLADGVGGGPFRRAGGRDLGHFCRICMPAASGIGHQAGLAGIGARSPHDGMDRKGVLVGPVPGRLHMEGGRVLAGKGLAVLQPLIGMCAIGLLDLGFQVKGPIHRKGFGKDDLHGLGRIDHRRLAPRGFLFDDRLRCEVGVDDGIGSDLAVIDGDVHLMPVRHRYGFAQHGHGFDLIALCCRHGQGPGALGKGHDPCIGSCDGAALG